MGFIKLTRLQLLNDMNETQIHYGDTKFDIRKFKSIKNRVWNKPSGGLWGSSISSDHNWEWFCESEGFRINKLSNCFKYRITGKIYEINSYQDLCDVPVKLNHPYIEELFIDFEKLRDLGYSAIHLTWEGQRDTRWSTGMSLYGWDVECSLLLNPNAIIFPKIYIYCRKNKRIKTSAGIFGSIKAMYRYYKNNIVQSLGDTVISEPIFSAINNKIIGKFEVKWKQTKN